MSRKWLTRNERENVAEEPRFFGYLYCAYLEHGRFRDNLNAFRAALTNVKSYIDKTVLHSDGGIFG